MTDEAAVSARGTELCATIEVDAAPEDVWRFVTDVAALSRRSHQVLRTVVAPSPVRLGSWMFNVNHSGWRVWPTSARVVRYSPFEEFAFRFNRRRSKARWLLFHRLAQQAVAVGPAPYHQIIATSDPAPALEAT